MTQQRGWIVAWNPQERMGSIQATSDAAEWGFTTGSWSSDTPPANGLEVLFEPGVNGTASSVSLARVHAILFRWVPEKGYGNLELDDGEVLFGFVSDFEQGNIEPAVGQSYEVTRGLNPQRGKAHVARLPAAAGPSAPRATATPRKRLKGTLVTWNDRRNFGTVRTDEGETYLLNIRRIANRDARIEIGASVRFGLAPHPYKPGEIVADEAIVRPPEPGSKPPVVDRSQRVRGVVQWWAAEGHGVFEGPDGTTVQAHRSQHRLGPVPQASDLVSYRIGPHPHVQGRICAFDFEVVGTGGHEEASLVIGAASLAGRGHAFNEDGFLVTRLEGDDTWVLAVADGVSKPAGTGAFGSDTALEVLFGLTRTEPGLFQFPEEPSLANDQMRTLLERVNTLFIDARRRAVKRYRSAHSTIALAVRRPNRRIHVGSVGDSRVLIEFPGDRAFRDLGTKPGKSGDLKSALGYAQIEPRVHTSRKHARRVLAIASDGIQLKRTGNRLGLYEHVAAASGLQQAAERSVAESVVAAERTDDATVILFSENPKANANAEEGMGAPPC